MQLLKKTLLAALVLAGLDTAAHVTLETREATTGSYYKAVLKVGHGCEGSATRAIEVTIPEGVQGAKPMPKAGWNLRIEKAKLAQPYQSHGKTFNEDVSRVIWEGGPLPDAFYDEFVMQVKLPDSPGTLYWKVKQICEQGENNWSEIPAADAPGARLKSPAAKLEVIPAAPAAHAH